MRRERRADPRSSAHLFHSQSRSRHRAGMRASHDRAPCMRRTASNVQRANADFPLASKSRDGMILRPGWAFSSVGRASARQAEGRRFESCNAHHSPSRNAFGRSFRNATLRELREEQNASRHPLAYRDVSGTFAPRGMTVNPESSGGMRRTASLLPPCVSLLGSARLRGS